MDHVLVRELRRARSGRATASLWVEIAAALAVAAALHAGALGAESPSRGPLTAETLWKLQRLANPAFSPDGAWAAVPVAVYDIEKDKGMTDLWLVPTGGGEERAR
jgi:hypothetical protein